jgi:hypothetical protein
MLTMVTKAAVVTVATMVIIVTERKMATMAPKVITTVSKVTVVTV